MRYTLSMFYHLWYSFLSLFDSLKFELLWIFRKHNQIDESTCLSVNTGRQANVTFLNPTVVESLSKLSDKELMEAAIFSGLTTFSELEQVIDLGYHPINFIHGLRLGNCTFESFKETVLAHKMKGKYLIVQ